MKRSMGLLLFGCAILFVAGCGEKPPEEPPVEPPPAAVIVPQEPPEEEAPPEEEVFPFAFPLTGIGTEEEMTARPVVVLVENSPRARPQSGLHQADIVFEILAEGDITRFVTVYHSEAPETIGPVRSARSYFVQLGYELDAIFVHAGWSQGAKNILVKNKMNHLDAVYGDHDYYWRSSERVAPHNLYTSIEKIAAGAEKKKFRIDEWKNPQLKFLQKEELPEGEAFSKARIPYIGGYFVEYEYDAEEALFKRLMLGEPHLDKETETQIVARNVLVLKTVHRIVDKEGRREVNIVGPGEGHLLQQGLVREIEWKMDKGIIRAYADGEELGLLPGKTWIHLIPTSSNFTYE